MRESTRTQQVLGRDDTGRADAAGADLVAGRFALQELVGEGAFGVVYDAHDREQDVRVAIKLLQRMSADALLRFKREFRSLQDVQHPNLVDLYELVEDDGRWFFTMEFVEGTDLLRYVRHDDEECYRFDESRLRAVMMQLAKALSALHARGMVHRDVKPSNVLVTAEQRAVLLDFGLVSDLSEEQSAHMAAGTLAYMAPEQGRGLPPGPAGDWYAFGVVLYEALVGTLPFADAGLQVLISKQNKKPPTPSQRGADAPADLEALCMELMAAEPEDRPDGEEILAKLRAGLGQPRRISVPQPQATAAPRDSSVTSTGAAASTGSTVGSRRFVGRERELRALGDAYEKLVGGEAALVAVEGESGLGKSALVRQLTEGLDRSNHLVLWGRCHERETVPYNALDGAVDQLSRALQRMADSECQAVLPRGAVLLQQLFPVLGSVQAIAASARPGGAPTNPTALRERTFRAFRELFGRLGERRRLVLVLDDLQWADNESLVLLDELLRPPTPPSVLVLATMRAGDETPEAVRAALEGWREGVPSLATLRLGQLGFEQSRALALQLMGDGADMGRAERIARESQGHPLFIETLVRYSESADGRELDRFEDALACLVGGLDAEAQNLLKVVCLAGAPMRQRVVGQAAGVPAESVRRLVGNLRTEKLVRLRRRNAYQDIEPYHDRIRVAVVDALSDAERGQLHRGLAGAMAAEDHPDSEALARHWEGGGEPLLGASAALAAGEQAVVALAFEKAAQMYDWALRLNPELEGAQQVRVKLAEAWSRAGRVSAAAEAYGEALQAAQGLDATRLRRCRAEHLLQVGEIDRGMEEARHVLQELGISLSSSKAGNIASIGWGALMLKLRGQQVEVADEQNIAPDVLERIDTLHTFAAALGPLLPMVPVELSVRHLRLALAAGEPGRVGRAWVADAFSLFYMGADYAAIEEQIARAEEMGKRTDDPSMRGFIAATAGTLRNMMCQSEQALRDMDEAEAIGVDHGVNAGWLTGIISQVRAEALRRAGRIDVLIEQYPRLYRTAVHAEDPYTRLRLLYFAAPAYYLALDDPHQADVALSFQVQEAYRPCVVTMQSTIVTQRFLVDAYRGEDAAGGLLERWDEVEQSGMLRFRHTFDEPVMYLGFSHLLGHGPTAQGERGARKAIKKLRARGSDSRATVLEAAVAWHQGDGDAAVEQLARAVELARQDDNAQLLVPPLEYQHARLRGTSAEPDRQKVQAELAAQGVRDPVRWCRALIPGFGA